MRTAQQALETKRRFGTRWSKSASIGLKPNTNIVHNTAPANSLRRPAKRVSNCTRSHALFGQPKIRQADVTCTVLTAFWYSFFESHRKGHTGHSQTYAQAQRPTVSIQKNVFRFEISGEIMWSGRAQIMWAGRAQNQITNRRLPVDDMRRMQLPNGAGDLGAIAKNREGA